MVRTTETREHEHLSLEVIDLTGLPDAQPTTTGLQQTICLSESAPFPSHEANDQTLIILSDEETESTNAITIENNQSNRSINEGTGAAAPFRGYINAPVFDYDFIRDSYIEEESPEGSVYFPSSDIETDLNEENLRNPETDMILENNPPLAREAEAHIVPLAVPKPPESGENNMGIKCSICLDNPQKLTTTFCGHLFCDECIHRSIKTPSKSCPVCRKPLTQKKMRILQLRVLPTQQDHLSKTKRCTSEENLSKKKVKISIAS